MKTVRITMIITPREFYSIYLPFSHHQTIGYILGINERSLVYCETLHELIVCSVCHLSFTLLYFRRKFSCGSLPLPDTNDWMTSHLNKNRQNPTNSIVLIGPDVVWEEGCDWSKWSHDIWACSIYLYLFAMFMLLLSIWAVLGVLGVFYMLWKCYCIAIDCSFV